MLRKVKCSKCLIPMSIEDIMHWYRYGTICCDSRGTPDNMCGCMGMPINPPICIKCLEVIK